MRRQWLGVPVLVVLVACGSDAIAGMMEGTGDVFGDAGRVMRDAGVWLQDAGASLFDAGHSVRDAGQQMRADAQAQELGVRAETFEANCIDTGTARYAERAANVDDAIAVTAFACGEKDSVGIECVTVLPGFSADRLRAGCPEGRTKVTFTILR